MFLFFSFLSQRQEAEEVHTLSLNLCVPGHLTGGKASAQSRERSEGRGRQRRVAEPEKLLFE